VNVNKGSRQIKPVTLGKRLALMIEYQVNLDSPSTVKLRVSLLKLIWENLFNHFWRVLKLERFYLPLLLAIKLELLRTRRIRLFN